MLQMHILRSFIVVKKIVYAYAYVIILRINARKGRFARTSV